MKASTYLLWFLLGLFCVQHPCRLAARAQHALCVCPSVCRSIYLTLIFLGCFRDNSWNSSQSWCVIAKIMPFFFFHRCGDSHRGSVSLCLTPVLSPLHVWLVLPKNDGKRPISLIPGKTQIMSY